MVLTVTSCVVGRKFANVVSADFYTIKHVSYSFVKLGTGLEYLTLSFRSSQYTSCSEPSEVSLWKSYKALDFVGPCLRTNGM